MTITFYKYQGTGNDFIMLDDRGLKISNKFPSMLEKAHVLQLCHRRFGIGADGLILLQDSIDYDFKMKYFNSDGAESSMCGNGGRCIVAFAKKLGIIDEECAFEAIDGPHRARIDDKNNVSLEMQNVDSIYADEKYSQLDTGSPHYVQYVKNIDELDVKKEGGKIRYSELYAEDGINVNFIEKGKDGSLNVRTYERGVEDETYSCGTGVTASAIAAAQVSEELQNQKIKTLGGNLEVEFIKSDDTSAKDIWLIGPATFVFQGEITAEAP